MAKHRSYSVAFKRQVAQEFLAGETLHGPAKRHDLSRNLIRVWVAKHEAPRPQSWEQAVHLIHTWNDRKRNVFARDHIRVAWDGLSAKGWL